MHFSDHKREMVLNLEGPTADHWSTTPRVDLSVSALLLGALSPKDILYIWPRISFKTCMTHFGHLYSPTKDPAKHGGGASGPTIL